MTVSTITASVAALAALVAATGLALSPDLNQPTIGGTPVPATLQCQEDEVIAFSGVDTLECLHLDNFTTNQP